MFDLVLGVAIIIFAILTVLLAVGFGMTIAGAIERMRGGDEE